MTTKYYIYASQQWRELDVTSGEVTGWRERSQFVYLRRGKLHVASRASVLRGLRELALGRSGSVRPGPLVSYKRRKPDRHHHKKQLQETWEPHHSCMQSHSYSCNTDVNSNQIAITTPQKQSTATQCTVDVGTQVDRVQRAEPAAERALSPAKRNYESVGKELPVANKRQKLRHYGSDDQNQINLTKSLETIQKEFTYEEDKNVCRQIIIYDEDVSVFRNFLINNKTDVDLMKFDNDQVYKTKIFYAINPVVNVERCNFMNDNTSQDDELSIEEFAEKLGLRSSNIINEPVRFKTRNRVYKKHRVESPSSNEEPNIKDVFVKSKLKAGKNYLSKFNSKPMALSTNLRLLKGDRSKPTISLRQMHTSSSSGTSSEVSSSSDAQNFRTKPKSPQGGKHLRLVKKLLNSSKSRFSSSDDSSSSDSNEGVEKLRRKMLTRTSKSKRSSSEGSSSSDGEKSSRISRIQEKNSTAKSSTKSLLSDNQMKKPENRRMTRTTNKISNEKSYSSNGDGRNSNKSSKAKSALSDESVKKTENRRLTRTSLIKNSREDSNSSSDNEINSNKSSQAKSALTDERVKKTENRRLTRTSINKISREDSNTSSDNEINSNKSSKAKSVLSDESVKKTENRRLTRTSIIKNSREDSNSSSDNEINSNKSYQAKSALSDERVENPKRLTRTTSNSANNDSFTREKEKNLNMIAPKTNSGLINEKLQKPENNKTTRETIITSNNNRSNTDSSRRERETSSSENRGKNPESRRLTRSSYKCSPSEESSDSDSNTRSSKSKISTETSTKGASSKNVNKLPNGSSEERSMGTTSSLRGNNKTVGNLKENKDDMSETSDSEFETNNTSKGNKNIIGKKKLRRLTISKVEQRTKETNKTSKLAANEDKENKANQTNKHNIRNRVLDKLNRMGSRETSVEEGTIEEKNDVSGSNVGRGKQKSNGDSDGRAKNVEPKKLSGPKFKIPKRSSVPPGREYSSMEDHAIVAWVSTGTRARAVNGNALWQELQQQYSRITGQVRSWHSLRNRYLRYILPALPALALPPPHAARLRAAAAAGKLKSKNKRAVSSPPRAPPALPTAWSRRPPARAAPHRENDVEVEPNRARRSLRATDRDRSPPTSGATTSSKPGPTSPSTARPSSPPTAGPTSQSRSRPGPRMRRLYNPNAVH